MSNRSHYGPQHVGGTFYCGYWRYEYTVLAINPDGSITTQITKPGVFANTTIGVVGEITTHRTGWVYGSDKVVAFRPITEQKAS